MNDHPCDICHHHGRTIDGKCTHCGTRPRLGAPHPISPEERAALLAHLRTVYPGLYQASLRERHRYG